jgi:hypothetical protein
MYKGEPPSPSLIDELVNDISALSPSHTPPQGEVITEEVVAGIDGDDKDAPSLQGG